MGWLWQDLRFGFRSLFKDRGFLVTAVLALALGIGSTTAIFSVIDNVLLEPFPYTDGPRLVGIRIHDLSRAEPGGRGAFPPPEFLDYQEQNEVFDRSIGVRQEPTLLTGQGAPQSFNAAQVTGNTFAFLGVPPLLGRALTTADATPGASPVFVLSYKVWQSRFGGDPKILGRVFTLNNKPTTLIGIMPQRFAWWGCDMWLPTILSRSENGPDARYFSMLGHLKPGLNLDSAANLDILARRFSKVYPKNYPKAFRVELEPLVDSVVGRFRNTLYTLLAACGLLLLIACGNVANLLLSRATSREKEFAIRASLGAARYKLVRQMMVESLILALFGAAAGCLVAMAGLQGLVALIPQFTFPDEAHIQLNQPVLLATMGTAILTALIFGLAPALGASKRDLNEPLKSGSRGNTGFRRGRMRNLLIVAEVALSLVLLVGAGLLMRSFALSRDVSTGFHADHILTTGIQLRGDRYKTPDQQARFLRELLPRLAQLPGVQSVAGALAFPPFGGINSDFEIAGKTHSERWQGQMVLSSPQFFETLQTPLVRGRRLTNEDINGQRHVILVNETFAARFFPRQDPLGKSVKLTALTTAPVPLADPWFTIVGVSADMKNHGIRQPVDPEVYAPYSLSSYGGFQLFVRTAGNPTSLTRAVEGQILALDSEVVPQRTASMESEIDLFQFAQPRFGLILFSVFAVMGLILVTVGIYSVVSYTVSQQRYEIGIRLALGATAADVRSLVIMAGLKFIFIGTGVGLALALVMTRVLASEFWGVTVYDPLTLGAVVLLIATIGLLACYFPSRRASRVDPAISLRFE